MLYVMEAWWFSGIAMADLTINCLDTTELWYSSVVDVALHIIRTRSTHSLA